MSLNKRSLGHILYGPSLMPENLDPRSLSILIRTINCHCCIVLVQSPDVESGLFSKSRIFRLLWLHFLWLCAFCKWFNWGNWMQSGLGIHIILRGPLIQFHPFVIEQCEWPELVFTSALSVFERSSTGGCNHRAINPQGFQASMTSLEVTVCATWQQDQGDQGMEGLLSTTEDAPCRTQNPCHEFGGTSHKESQGAEDAVQLPVAFLGMIHLNPFRLGSSWEFPFFIPMLNPFKPIEVRILNPFERECPWNKPPSCWGSWRSWPPQISRSPSWPEKLVVRALTSDHRDS